MLLFFVLNSRLIIEDVITLYDVQSGDYHNKTLEAYALDEDEMWRQPESMRKEAVGQHVYEYTEYNLSTLRKLRT